MSWVGWKDRVTDGCMEMEMGRGRFGVCFGKRFRATLNSGPRAALLILALQPKFGVEHQGVPLLAEVDVL